MFRQQPPVTPPPQEPEPSGFRFEIRLTEAALLKLLPWIIPVAISGVVGAGWHGSQTKPSIPAPAAPRPEVVQPQK